MDRLCNPIEINERKPVYKFGERRTQKLMEVLFTASMPFLTHAVVHSTLTYMVKFHKDQ